MNILIAYDGSNAATAALEDLTRAGLPQQAHAIVLTVADIWLPPAGVKTAELQIPVKSLAVERATKKGLEAQKAAKQIADRGAVVLRERFPSWSIESRAVADSPAWGTIKLAGDWPADFIVVGSQGQSAINRVVFGSVSQKIAIEAKPRPSFGSKLSHVSCLRNWAMGGQPLMSWIAGSQPPNACGAKGAMCSFFSSHV